MIFNRELSNLYWPLTLPYLLSPPAQKQHLPFTKKSRSASTTSDNKEVGAGEAQPTRKVFPVTSAAGGRGGAVSIVAATSLITNAEGWTWDPFLGHSM